MLYRKTKKIKLTPRPWAHDWNNPVERKEKKKHEDQFTKK
jgi:hypothetical protein